MDIAYYISDLLGQQGELTVPNLGYFVQIRMPAYYDSEQKKFFPPHYSVQFDPQIIDDDDTLAGHITAVKRISISSAKYFIEKYINNLKDQAFIEEVPFANMGTFTSDGVRLNFNTQTKTDDPAFFAYQSVEAVKIGEVPIRKTAPVTVTLTPPPPQDTTETYVAAEQVAPPPVPVAATVITPVALEEEKFDAATTPFFGASMVSNRVNPGEQVAEEEAEPRRVGIWLIVGIAFTLLIIGLGVLYKFKPELFGKAYLPSTPTKTETKAAAPVLKDTTPVASAVQTTVNQDSLAKADSAKKAAEKPVAKPVTINKDTAKISNLTFTPDKNKPSAPVTVSSIAPGINNPMPAIVPKGADVITAGAFNRKKPAQARVTELKRKGFEQARLMTETIAPGGNYKVILGVYATKEFARQAYKEFLATGKLKKEDISVEQNKKSLD
ncbi:HU domain-containing protein [Mucilaginibacter myungsuensis]|uniref:SPOR domain-containing protein n=1 Tax=Mucilaginibacter myungsuensis TaxID=649104 RepID=A0A929PX83_9SPHI|nr:SPOR domain-containing protein [Mucilaginibacter myungsuensis]MBE9663588.1 SPOR domain-containing protein [Mucilaginibacter myungsuensis]MDN3599088.1 SPOR domain-containing protein [Mucilaginibacter myungsuensis]